MSRGRCGCEIARQWRKTCLQLIVRKAFLQSDVLGEVCVLEGGEVLTKFRTTFWAKFLGLFCWIVQNKVASAKNSGPKFHGKIGENSGKSFMTRFCRWTPAKLIAPLGGCFWNCVQGHLLRFEVTVKAGNMLLSCCSSRGNIRGLECLSPRVFRPRSWPPLNPIIVDLLMSLLGPLSTFSALNGRFPRMSQ